MDEFDDLIDSSEVWVDPRTFFPIESIMSRLEKCQKVTKVYRIEDSDGVGPYGSQGWQKTAHTPATGRPTPNSDEGFREHFPEEIIQYGWFDILKKKTENNVLFGFSSLKQLKSWFHNEEELKTILEMGFKIKEYDVEGFDSGTQVIFFSNYCFFRRLR